jgi:hypothetical protein
LRAGSIRQLLPGTGFYRAAHDLRERCPSIKRRGGDVDKRPDESIDSPRASRRPGVVDPAALGPDDAFQAYELRYKIMGQTGTLILALPPAP